jgi:uncharacterized membrane protein
MYALFKFVHIVAVVVWIGGLLTIGVLNARFARRENTAALAAMARHSRFIATSVSGPAAGIALIAGVAMMTVAGLGFELWLVWGMTVMALSMTLGGTLLRRAGAELSERLPTSAPGDARIGALERRLATASALNIALLLSAIAMMVFKPTL